MLSAISSAALEGLSNEEATVEEERDRLERVTFLLFWALRLVDSGKTTAADIVAAVAATTKKAAAKKAPAKSTRKAAAAHRDDDGDEKGSTAGPANWTEARVAAVGAMAATLRMPLGKMWSSSHDRDAYVGLSAKLAWTMLESPEMLKSAPLKEHLVAVLTLGVAGYSQSFAAVTSIVQNLTYFAHAPEAMAELVATMAAEPYNCTSVSDDVIAYGVLFLFVALFFVCSRKPAIIGRLPSCSLERSRRMPRHLRPF